MPAPRSHRNTGRNRDRPRASAKPLLHPASRRGERERNEVATLSHTWLKTKTNAISALVSRPIVCVFLNRICALRRRAGVRQFLLTMRCADAHGKEIEMRKPTLREVAYVGAGTAALALLYYRNDLASATSMISAAGLTGLADQLASRRGKKAKPSKRGSRWWRSRRKPR